MKVLIISNSVNGLFKFRRELIEKLIERNVEVYVIAPEGEFLPELLAIGCQYIKVNIESHGKNPVHDLQLVRRYIKVLRKLRPDYALTYTIKPNVYGGIACSYMRVPYIANITGLGTALESGGMLGVVTSILYKIGLRKAKKVFFQNESNMNYMVSHRIVKSKYELIPGSGVNLTQYELLEYPKEETVDFVFIARIKKEKGIDQYLDAAEKIQKKYPYTRFHICGKASGSYLERLNQLNDQGKIIYHGMVKDITEIHRICQCTIHPTYYPEGLSNVLLESAACGRPIITTNRPGCREVVDDEKNGLLIKEKDTEDLINKIEEFLSMTWEKRKEMGLYGRKLVKERFDRQIVIDKYFWEMNIYNL